MKLAGDGHSHFQELISARLDGMLTSPEEQELSEHLAECPTCRSIARDYRTQRSLLSSLPARPAPRDLWARTAAALDREMAGTPRASGWTGARRGGTLQGRSAPGSRWLGLTAATSVLLAGAVVATQLQGTVAPTTGLGTRLVQPTPFDVAPQDMSVFDFTAHGLAVYQTRVSKACPVLSIDCTSLQLPTNPVIKISGTSIVNRGLAVSARSGQLALVTSADSGAETVSVVRLPQYRNTGATAAPTERPTVSEEPSSSAFAPVTPSPRTPKPTLAPTPAPTPTHAGSGATATPDPSTPKPVRTHRPTALPTVSPSVANPTPADTPVAPQPTDTAPATNADGSLPQADEVAMAIVEGVKLVGAAPAWSNEGDRLAFSATPADRSTGPDIYLYTVGQDRAVRLTSDHRSYFASWAADRIVISRAPADDTAGAVDVSTVVMDLATGEERTVGGLKLWLPTVEPSGRYAVTWVGRLHTDGVTVTPRFGGLYLLDWTAIDPFAQQATDASASPSADASPRDTPAATPPTSRPDPTLAPTRTPRGHHPAATAIAPTDAPATSTPTPAATAPSVDASSVLQATDPQRDETADPVLDWVVRWSADGNTVGIWVADTSGSNWGRLAIVGVSFQAAQFAQAPVLGPTLARRAFSLGVDRVAWVAPSDDATNGELRIRTWGARGYGDIRIHNVDTGNSQPSF